MPFFNWSLLKSRTLHPDIGIPADDTQGLPYLSYFNVLLIQNYGIAVKTYSGTDSITGYLFTANTRYTLGSGEAKNMAVDNTFAKSMFAVDSLNGHVFATTASGIINNPISINGNVIGWSGGQSAGIQDCSPQTTFFNYGGANYVGFGNAESANFAIFKPGGIVKTYSDYVTNECLQPCAFYNGLYTIRYSSSGYGDQYGFISLADAPEILPALTPMSIISYSFTESAIIISPNNGAFYGYDGINDPTLASSFIKLAYPFKNTNFFGFDPLTGRLLSISTETVTVGGHVYYPVYVYNSVFAPITPPTPQQYTRPVKNFTVNGHLNWRKQR